MDGLGLSIATTPETFRNDDATGWSRIMLDERPGIPAIRIWFTYDDEKVYIERVDLLSEYL